MMKVVFIAGPYSGTRTRKKEVHIEEAEEVAITLWERGYVAVCPHLNSKDFDDYGLSCNVECFNWGYLELLSRCDAVFAMPNWNESPGARQEIALAKHLRIPVITSIEALDEVLT